MHHAYPFIATLLLATVGPWPASVMAQDAGILRGTVVAASSLRPIDGALVRLEPGDQLATTDSGGTFRIPGVVEGLYAVSVRRVGYLATRLVNVRVTRGKASIFQFVLSPITVTIDKTVVSGDPFPRDPAQGVGRSTYTADEIRRTPGAADDIFRAIETLPGVSSNGGGFSAFSVRGGGPHDNLILIDDIPFDKVTHLEGGAEGDEAQGGRLSIFAPDLVQSADFRAGGFPAQYGGKSASMLLLRLKDGNTETATYGGRYDLLGWEADYDGPSRINGATSILFSARHQNLAEALKIIGRRDAGTPSFTDLILKSTTTLGARHKVSVLGILAPEQATRTVRNVLEESDTNDTQLYDWHETKGVLGVSWQWLAGRASVIQSAVYVRRYTRTDHQGDSYPDLPIADGGSIASRPNILSYEESETDVGLRSTGHVIAGRNTLVLSVEAAVRNLSGARSVDGADTLYTFGQFDPRPSPSQYYLIVHPETYDARIDRRVATLAAASTYERAFGADGSIAVGARYEHDGVSDHNDVLPRASVTFPTVRGLSFSVAGGVYLQPLDLRDLIGNPLNARVSPERSTHFIAGVSTLLRPDVKLSVEGYYRTLSDLPILQDRSSGLESATGTGFASGIDATLLKRLTDRLFGQIGYSYAVSKRNDNRGLPTYNGDVNRPHSVNVLGGYTLNKRWSFSGKFKIASGDPTDTYLVHDNIFPGTTLDRFSREIVGHNARRFPPLETLNLRIDYRAHLGRVGFDAFLDVLNVYNYLNVTDIRFADRSGRSIVQGVGAVPTFGLKVSL